MQTLNLFCILARFYSAAPSLPVSPLPVSERRKWQLLFPQQLRAKRGGETRLRPPLEENETRSKHGSPEGAAEGEQSDRCRLETQDENKTQREGENVTNI